jgi:hypothetical protein
MLSTKELYDCIELTGALSNGNKRVLADGMYYSNKNFQYLSKNHIDRWYKDKKSQLLLTVILGIRRQTNLKRWKVFSSIRRTFGEHVKARKFHNVTKEIIMKASLYNMFIPMRI